jgi:hypothetical protein
MSGGAGSDSGHNTGQQPQQQPAPQQHPPQQPAPQHQRYRYDEPKSALKHALDFWLDGNGPVCAAVDPDTLKIAVERKPADTTPADYYRWFMTGDGGKKYHPALRLGLCRNRKFGLLAIQFDNRGPWVPKLPLGQYGPEHTYIGNALLRTKRVIIDTTNYPPTSFAVLFGYLPSEFPYGLRTRELVQQTLDGMGNIRLLAEGSYLPIEPAGNRRSFTPLSHTAGDGTNTNTNTLYSLGIITLDRESLTEMMHAFDPGWAPEKG